MDKSHLSMFIIPNAFSVGSILILRPVFQRLHHSRKESVCRSPIQNPVVEGIAEIDHGPDGDGVIDHHRTFWIIPVPRMPLCGWLMMGVANREPLVP